jgi:2-aminoadipate transaminase
MLLCLNKYLKQKAMWNIPAGGIFIWLKIKKGGCRELYKKAVDSGIAFMPGYPFYANMPKENTLRLTFATISKKEILKGIKILSKILPPEN